MRARSRTLLLTLAVPAALAGTLAGLTALQVRRERLDRELIKAVWRRDPCSVRALLDRGADPDARDRRREPPVSPWERLLRALGRGRKAAGERALVLALDAYPGDLRSRDIALLLLARGADPDRAGLDGCAPLFHAVYNPDLSLTFVRALLARGADPRARDGQGATALMDAAFSGALMDAALSSAGRGKWMLVLEALRSAGIDVNATDREGYTALMYAIMAGDDATMRWLLDHGADPNRRLKDGTTALRLARSYFVYSRPAVRMLRQAGARE